MRANNSPWQYVGHDARLATPEQARSIIDEYRRRHAETGDAYRGGVSSRAIRSPGVLSTKVLRQGGYANGGLMRGWAANCAARRSCSGEKNMAWNSCARMPIT